MAKIPPVEIKLKVLDQATKNLEGIGRSFKKMSKDISQVSVESSKAATKMDMLRKKMGAIGAAGAVVGASMTAALTLPIVGAARSMLKESANYEDALNNMKAATGSSAQEMEILDKAVRSAALGSRFTATTVTEAATALGKAGMKADEVAGSISAVVGLNAIEGMGMEESANFLSSVLTMFGESGKKAREEGKNFSDIAKNYADVLSRASGESQISLKDLENSMKYSGLVAAELGYTVNDTASAIAALGKLGIRGEMAGTTMRNLSTSLFGRSRSIAALKDAGVTEADLFARNKSGELDPNKKLPLEKILENLSKKSLSLIQINKIFGVEFGSTMARAISQYKVFSEMRKELVDPSGDVEKKMAEKNKGLNASIDRLMSTWTEFSIRVMDGKALTAISKVVDKIGELILWFTELDPAIQNTVFIITGLLAVLGPIVAFVSMLAIGFSMLSTAAAAVSMTIGGLIGTAVLVTAKIMLIIAAVGALGALLVDLVMNFKDFGTFLADIFTNPKRAWEKFLYWAEDRLGWLRNLVGAFIPSVKDFKTDASIMGRHEWNLGDDKLKRQPITPFANPEEWLKAYKANSEMKLNIDMKNVPKGTEITTQTTGGAKESIPIGRTKNVSNKSNYKVSAGGGK